MPCRPSDLGCPDHHTSPRTSPTLSIPDSHGIDLVRVRERLLKYYSARDSEVCFEGLGTQIRPLGEEKTQPGESSENHSPFRRFLVPQTVAHGELDCDLDLDSPVWFSLGSYATELAKNRSEHTLPR